MTTEVWRAVVGWQGLYEVSDQGRLRSLNRTVRQRNATRIQRGRTLQPVRGVAKLSRGGRTTAVRLDRLVLEAFTGPAPPGWVARHLNGDANDCRAANLRWGPDTTPKARRPRAALVHCNVAAVEIEFFDTPEAARRAGEACKSKACDEHTTVTRAEGGHFHVRTERGAMAPKPRSERNNP